MTESLSWCAYVLFPQNSPPLQLMKNPCFFNSLLERLDFSSRVSTSQSPRGRLVSGTIAAWRPAASRGRSGQGEAGQHGEGKEQLSHGGEPPRAGCKVVFPARPRGRAGK